MSQEGYIHGSDMILYVESGDPKVLKALGHSKSCEIQNQAETKERATKQTSNSGKWVEKSVSRLTVSINAEGFSFYGDQMGYPELLSIWETGKPVTLKYAHRGEEETKYRTGQFVITSVSETSPSDDDASYSISFENTGEVTTVVVNPGA